MTNLLRLEKGSQISCDEETAELINGVIYHKAELSENHKDIVRNLYGLASKIILTQRPLDTVLRPQEQVVLPVSEHTIVRPEIAMTMKGESVPAWIVEVVPEGSEEIPFLLKTNLYMQAGVKQYWIIDPEREIILDYRFETDGLIPAIYEAPRRIKLIMYKESYISYTDVFKSRTAEEKTDPSK